MLHFGVLGAFVRCIHFCGPRHAPAFQHSQDNDAVNRLLYNPAREHPSSYKCAHACFLALGMFQFSSHQRELGPLSAIAGEAELYFRAASCQLQRALTMHESFVRPLSLVVA